MADCLWLVAVAGGVFGSQVLDHFRGKAAGWPWRMNKPKARKAMATEQMGSHIEYHHCGTPMPGEVSS